MNLFDKEEFLEYFSKVFDDKTEYNQIVFNDIEVELEISINLTSMFCFMTRRAFPILYGEGRRFENRTDFQIYHGFVTDIIQDNMGLCSSPKLLNDIIETNLLMEITELAHSIGMKDSKIIPED